MSFVLALAIAAAPIPDVETAEAMIAERDAALFYEAFQGCDTDRLRTFFDAPYRMLHDKAGMVAETADQFVGQIKNDCQSKDPNVYANRREFVDGSRKVQLLGTWGALEEGHHIFFESNQGSEFQPVGRARYLHVWRWDGEAFVLHETLSVDHGPY